MAERFADAGGAGDAVGVGGVGRVGRVGSIGGVGGVGGGATPSKPKRRKKNPLRKTPKEFGKNDIRHDKEKLLKYINPADLISETKWPTTSSGFPSCMQGIIYMDQACTNKVQLPNVKCSFEKPKLVGREYSNSIATWDEKSRCLTFRIKGAWTIGSPKSSASCSLPVPKFCQTSESRKKHEPCDTGAFFHGAGKFPFFHMIKTDWGWDRQSGWGPATLHYPVLQIVDGSGKKTKWWDGFYKEVTRTGCSYPTECRLNEFTRTSQIGVCREKEKK